MSKRDDFILDAVTGIDDDIIEKNLQKRFKLWMKKGKKKLPWMRIAAVAACLCIVEGGLIFLFDSLFCQSTFVLFVIGAFWSMGE